MNKRVVIRLAIFLTTILFVFVCLSIASRQSPGLGVVDGRLAPCSTQPNCVCTEETNDGITVNDTVASWERAKLVIRNMGGKIDKQDDIYLHATFTTPVLRFIDDVELRLDVESKKIQVRSSSRVGYSDFGVNNARLKKFKAEYEKMGID